MFKNCFAFPRAEQFFSSQHLLCRFFFNHLIIEDCVQLLTDVFIRLCDISWTPIWMHECVSHSARKTKFSAASHHSTLITILSLLIFIWVRRVKLAERDMFVGSGNLAFPACACSVEEK